MTRHDLQVAHDEPPVALDTAAINAFAIGLVDVGRDAYLDCRTQLPVEMVSSLPEMDLRRVVLALALLAGGIAARQGNRDWWNEVAFDGCR